MLYIVIGGIIIYILYHFLSDLNKDNKDLKNQTVYEKFKVLAEKNNYSQDFYNTSEGNKILNKMATNDDAESQYNLATKYFKEKEFKSAAYWFRKSADNGYEKAQKILQIIT